TVIAENGLAVAIRDEFPVTPFHSLVIPKRHIEDYFDLFVSEHRAVQLLADEVRREIQTRDSTVEGFNVGVNSGTAAGQTVSHCHVHIIPRRVGDVANPRGGVRGIIPGKADYLVT